jgi:hypothetical protein
LEAWLRQQRAVLESERVSTENRVCGRRRVETRDFASGKKALDGGLQEEDGVPGCYGNDTTQHAETNGHDP